MKKKQNSQHLEASGNCCDGNDVNHNDSSSEKASKFRIYLPAIFSFVMLIAGIIVDYLEVFPHFPVGSGFFGMWLPSSR